MIRVALGVLALIYALTHLPYLVSTLEDIDSVNFALGLRDFDVAAHRPHPPGYPAYIALGKVAVAIGRTFGGDTAASTIEARTLSLLALVGAVASIFLLYRVLSCWSVNARPTSLETLGATSSPSLDLLSAPWRQFDARAVAATALVVACPLFWYLGVRPMSDVPGFAAALAAQTALALAWWRQQPDSSGGRRLSPDHMVASGRMIVFGSLLAGLSIGFRSQNAMLTVPLLLGVLTDRIGRGVAGALLGSAVAFSAGILVWAIPMVIASGGLNAYLAALGSQAGEDFASGEMLYQNPTPRLAAYGLLRTFIYPWDSVALGGVVTGLAALGSAAMAFGSPRSLAGVSLVLLPYLAFHLLFQDTTFVRYALPLVPPVALLAVYGLASVFRQAALPIVGGLALWAVAVATPVLAAYGSEASPTVRVIKAMQAAAATPTPSALAFHQTFRRPLEAEVVPIGPLLASPPRREWLELVSYWRGGRLDPLWFLADPRRSDLALIDPHSRADRTDFSWRFSSLSDLGGMRPTAVTWYRMTAPGWFAAEGWALTPETAGIARLMGQGPSIAPITAWVRRRSGPVKMMIGGRHLGVSSDPSATFVVRMDTREVARWESTAGFFLHEFDLPSDALAGTGSLAQLTVESTSPAGTKIPTAIEQFDLQSSDSMMWAYDEGWHEAEYEPSVGVWRWTSERSTLRIMDASTPIAITLRVERPRRYFDDDPVVRMRAGNLVVSETRFQDTSVWSVIVSLNALQASQGRVIIETNRTFVPAEEGGPADRRHLGLRVFGVNIATQP